MPSDRLLVVCPVLPFPPIDGGRKRTLRLLEAAAAAGFIPHILTTDGEDPTLVAALRERGWAVEAVAGDAHGRAARGAARDRDPLRLGVRWPAAGSPGRGADRLAQRNRR